jgi:hypothetical protein
MENFDKVIENSQPYIERTIVPKGAKVSFKSQLIVRFQYIARKAFRKISYQTRLIQCAVCEMRSGDSW